MSNKLQSNQLSSGLTLTSPVISGGSVTGITDLAVADGGTGASDASGARTNLGLGTIATQNANNVTISGGSVAGITDLAVADGGTGASDASGARTNLGLGTIATQNANNVNISGGAIAGITDLAVADGGTGASTAAAARDNLGLGTANSPQFTAIELGAVSDTTVARASAGDISVEGNIVYRAGGTDVPVTDGGTGASTSSGARTNLAIYSSTFGVVPANDVTDPTNDILFASGVKRDSSNIYTIIAAASMIKRADAGWAAGTNQGGMAAGVTWGANDFHLFILGKQSDPTAYDYIFDTSLTCANGLATAAVISAGFNVYRRVASFRTAGAAWPLFTAREVCVGLIEVLLSTPVYQFDKDWAGVDDAAQTGTLGNIPGGIQVNAILGVAFRDATIAASSVLLVTSLDQANTAANSGFGTYVGTLNLSNDGSAVDRSASGIVNVRTSTSRTFRYRTVGSTVDHAATVCLHGWEDTI